MTAESAYLICSTPRTGSTFLCAMLKSTGIAGVPESYFRKQDERDWAARWNIAHAPGGTFAFSDYLDAAMAAGRTRNGVFGARIMWGTMDELVEKITLLYPEHADNDKALLERVFGPTRFIFLRRADVVAQAVSRLRAEQTDLWHISDDVKPAMPRQEPQYDFEQIQDFIREANEHNAAWEKWFRSNKIKPYRVMYEDLDTDSINEIRCLLDFLEMDLPENAQIRASNKRLSDALNKEWIDRYRSEGGLD